MVMLNIEKVYLYNPINQNEAEKFSNTIEERLNG